MKQEIVEFIKRNRVSTTEVADCLNKTGALPNVMPINPKHFRVGPVFWCYAYGESNWSVHEQIRNVEEGHVVIVDAFDCKDRAVFGDLVTKFLILYRQAAAVVVNGNIRDVPRIIRENWPIWCRGVTPIGCFNMEPETAPDPALIAEKRCNYDGAIAVCDDCGVVVIPKAAQTREFLQKLAFIEDQEDIWYECIDKRKWDTFETVCLKKYLQQ